MLELAKAAASRGDYETALARIKEAELTYAVETKGEFNIWYFIARNSLQVAIATIIFIALAFLLSLRIRIFLINNELRSLKEEEDILLGLIRVVQKECFVEKKMGMAEYNQALLQYENKLGKAVQRTVELETIRANLMRFRKKEERFKQERQRLLDLMKDTQKKYLVGGLIETRVYYNKMRSFSTRLSEVEEKIALEEAKKALRKGKLIKAREKIKKAEKSVEKEKSVSKKELKKLQKELAKQEKRKKELELKKEQLKKREEEKAKSAEEVKEERKRKALEKHFLRIAERAEAKEKKK